MRKVDANVPHGACYFIDPHKDIHFKFIFVIQNSKVYICLHCYLLFLKLENNTNFYIRYINFRLN